MKCPELSLVRGAGTLASDWSPLPLDPSVDCTWLAEGSELRISKTCQYQFLVTRGSDIIIMGDPLVMLSQLQMSPDGDPRLLDTIFNVSSLTSGIFNNSLFQYAGAVIVGIILFGELSFWILELCYGTYVFCNGQLSKCTKSLITKLSDKYYH